MAAVAEVVDHAAQGFVPRHLENVVVKVGIRRDHGHKVVVAKSVLDLLDHLPEDLDVHGRRVLRGQTQGNLLERRTDHEEFFHFLLAEFTHNHSPEGSDGHHPLGFQDLEGIPHRIAAHPEHLGQGRLDQSFPRLKLACQDHVLDPGDEGLKIHLAFFACRLLFLGSHTLTSP